MSERTLVLIKPDGVRRRLVGEIIGRIERKGLTILAIEQRLLPLDLVEEHYAEHRGKPFYDGLVAFMTSGPVVAMVVEGFRAIEVMRTMMGVTDPAQAAPGTIRGDLSTDFGNGPKENVTHGSDSPASAEREIKLFFPHLS